MLAIGLGLAASVAWGSSDFLAGLKTRKLPVLAVSYTHLTLPTKRIV